MSSIPALQFLHLGEQYLLQILHVDIGEPRGGEDREPAAVLILPARPQAEVALQVAVHEYGVAEAAEYLKQ